MKQERFFQYYLVAFIDVLGQKQAFEGVHRLPQSEPERERLGQALRETVAFVEAFREGFESFFKTFSKATEILKRVPPEKRALLRELRKTDIGIRGFSDFVIAEVSLRGPERAYVAVNSILGIVAAAGAMMLVSLVGQHSVRGGIDVGLGIRLKSGEVYGPALNHVYGLESVVAQHPRIVVGQGLLDYLRANLHPSPNTPQERVAKNAAEVALGMISQDADGSLIVDYLSPGFRRVFEPGAKASGQDVALDRLIPQAFKFVRSESAKWKKAGNLKLASRYKLLEAYFRSKA